MIATLANAQFISDLHLTEDRPECIRAFFGYLENLPSHCQALFILGDFFEYWLGDDVQSNLADNIANALNRLSKRGVQLYFVAGNRDFALGNSYCEKAGMTLLADHSTFEIANKKVLVSHGDLFCQSDVQYQRLRKVLRNPLILSILKSLPRRYRQNLAEKLRAKSKQNFAMRQQLIDVDLPVINDTFTQTKVDLIVHGHTHIADIHQHAINGNEHLRMVLGDWHYVGWYGEISAEGVQLQRFAIKER